MPSSLHTSTTPRYTSHLHHTTYLHHTTLHITPPPHYTSYHTTPPPHLHHTSTTPRYTSPQLRNPNPIYNFLVLSLAIMMSLHFLIHSDNMVHFLNAGEWTIYSGNGTPTPVGGQGKLSAGAITGIVIVCIVGVFVIVLFLGAICTIASRRRKYGTYEFEVNHCIVVGIS